MSLIRVQVNLCGQEIGALIYKTDSGSLRNAPGASLKFGITIGMPVGEMLRRVKEFYLRDESYVYEKICLVVKGGNAYFVGDSTTLADAVVPIGNGWGVFDIMYNPPMVNIKHAATPYDVFARVPVPTNATFPMMVDIVYGLTGYDLSKYFVVRDDTALDPYESLDFAPGGEYYFTCYPASAIDGLMNDQPTEYPAEWQ